jgi:hypothetical protein
MRRKQDIAAAGIARPHVKVAQNVQRREVAGIILDNFAVFLDRRRNLTHFQVLLGSAQSLYLFEGHLRIRGMKFCDDDCNRPRRTVGRISVPLRSRAAPLKLTRTALTVNDVLRWPTSENRREFGGFG